MTKEPRGRSLIDEAISRACYADVIQAQMHSALMALKAPFEHRDVLPARAVAAMRRRWEQMGVYLDWLEENAV